MGLLTKSDILGSRLKSEIVEVPEWGGSVRIRELSAAQRDSWDSTFRFDQDGNATAESLRNMRARMCSLSIVDENDMPVFSPMEAEQLGQLSGTALHRVYAVCRRLNGMDDSTAKNSEATPDVDSTSG